MSTTVRTHSKHQRHHPLSAGIGRRRHLERLSELDLADLTVPTLCLPTQWPSPSRRFEALFDGELPAEPGLRPQREFETP